MIHTGETHCPSPEGQGAGAYVFEGEVSETEITRFADSLDGHQAVVDTVTKEIVVSPPFAEAEVKALLESGKPLISLHLDASRLAIGLGLESPTAETFDLTPAQPEIHGLAA